MKMDQALALVTGGGSGLGEAVCRYLAEQGSKVVILDKSEDAALRVAKITQGLALPCDITEAQSLEQAFQEIQATFMQPLSIVINCAGIAPAQRMISKSGPVDLSWFEEIIHINLIGTFNVMRLAAAMMIQASLLEQVEPALSDVERGVIINTASIAAFEGQIGQTAYSASKAGVVGMTLPAARELARFGIRVMTIAPGLFDTPLLEGLSKEVRSSLHSQALFPKRFGNPREFAELVGHIINNAFLNGEVIRLDGGMRMQAT
jgi:NAD(P)-dependent dehydrogenase (short-subunit alcohol dehydrogenase family)